jgi:hypothetical protein
MFVMITLARDKRFGRVDVSLVGLDKHTNSAVMSTCCLGLSLAAATNSLCRVLQMGQHLVQNVYRVLSAC